MTGEQLPREWAGELTECPPFWMWYSVAREWVIHSIGHGCDMVRHGCVFVPCGQPKPTIDPEGMKTIATCSKVDWND